MARRTAASKHVGILALGTFVLLLGAIISAVGAFRSVMHDAQAKGPHTSTDTLSNTAVNYRHYVALIAYFPEMFDCRDVRSIYASTTSDAELFIADIDIRENATFYCWRESGDAVWLYAFGFVISILYLALAFIAAFRPSGQQASLAGVGLSGVMLLWALLVIVHYQEHNNIPQAIQAFGECDNFAGIPASRTAHAPWAPANALVTADFGLEAYTNWNPTVLTGVSPRRAFYYSRRGGTDTFDETTFTTATGVQTALATPAVPVSQNVVLPVTAATAAVAATATTAATVLQVAAVAVPAIMVTTSHGQPDNVFYNIDYNRSPARIFGPTPRRSWLCSDEWNYDGTFRVSQNLVYGGLATFALGALIVLTAFGYLAYPILGVIKNPTVAITQQRASNLAEDLSEDYSDYSDY